MLRCPSLPSRARAASGLTVAFIVAAAGPSFAQGIDQNLWVTNGPVRAVARAGNTLYIGGIFSQVGPATGGGVPIDATSGAPESGFPKVVGYVSALAADGAGGWYIGGLFTAVGGIPRQNIAHILADKSVSSWDPGASSEVSALAVSGGRVYAGGYFGSIGGQTRNHIAALDTATGLATAWDPDANGNVYALALSGGKLYVGGEFTDIGRQERHYIAALDIATGGAYLWSPDASAPSSPMVNALAVSGDVVYAAGWFNFIGGQTRNNIAALDVTTGLATSWNPTADAPVNALAVSGTTVYAGGSFTHIGGEICNRIVALDATTGLRTGWNPNANSLVLTLAVSGSTVYAGGEFTYIGGQARNRIAALDNTVGEATAWNPNADKRVLAVAASGTTVYAGGWFTSLGGVARNNIAALDATTGIPTTWDPNVTGGVYALAVSGRTVYAGGSFLYVGGQPRNNIVALDATGVPTAWNPNSNALVFALAVDGSRVYAGGMFTSIGLQPRNRIAALDATTGNATTWNPDANDRVLALAVSGSKVYAGGSFTSMGVQTRNHIAALDATSGTVTGWDPNANFGVSALAVSGGRVYAGGDFTYIGGGARNHVAALDTATGLATGWNPNTSAESQVSALAVRGAAVYVGGQFTAIGGQVRHDIAAVDTATGLALPWNPDANDQVDALAVSEVTVYAGGAFTALGGLPRAHIASIAAAPVLTAILPASGGNAGPVSVTVLGSGLPVGSTTMLWRSGQPEILGTDVVVAGDGMSLNATFDLSGATPGVWDVVVHAPDGQIAVLANGFTVEALMAPQLRVDVVGPGVIRSSHPTAFDLMVENRGNVDALVVPVWLFGVPVDAVVAVDFPVASPPQAGGEPDWSTVPLTLTSPGGQYMALVLPRVPPGVTTRRVVLTVPPSHTEFMLGAAVTPPWADGTGLGGCLSGAGVITDIGCMGAQLTALNTWLVGTPGIAALNGVGAWAKIGWQCEGATTLPEALTQAEEALDFLGQAVEQETAPGGCGDVMLPRWREVREIAVATSIDPNDKLGVLGYGPSRLISGQQALPYSVRFENLATATAPAQQVVVVDALDLSTLDVDRVNLGTIAFGNVHLVPPPGLSSYATTVDLRPARNLLVQVSASLDRYTGVMCWYFSSIDPATGQPPSDPLVGFLPPNVTPPEGEGSVLFTAQPLGTLSTGTQIVNEAAITFDDPPAVETGEWLNTVDNTPPASHVLALSPNQDSVRFTVRWEATGAPTDLKDYTIYVAEDGGGDRAWRLNTLATADTFASVPGGHHYGFYSVARDQSGNVEAAPGSPDAETYSTTAAEEPRAWRLGLAGARPNPARGEMRVWLTLPSRQAATLELIDVAGRRVARREVGWLGPGTHVVVLDPGPRMRAGLYFLRLTQGGRVLTARVAVVR